MKRALCILVAIVLMGGLPARAQSSGEDYTKALQKKGAEQIRAFEEYIRKYPDTGATFTKYAHYWIAVGYYNLKNYGEAISRAEKSLQIGVPEKYNEAMLYLVLGNSFGIKDSPRHNREQALKYADRAIATAREAEGASDIIRNAEALKRGLAGAEPPPKRPVSNLDKMKKAYNDKKFDEVAGIYNALGEGDKQNQDYLEVYALALYQQKKYDAAIQKLTETFGKGRKGVFASLLGQMYAEKAKKDKALLDTAALWYAKASLLYAKEGKKDLKDANMDFATFQIGEKYNYNKRVADFNEKMKSQPKPVDNSKKIEKLKLELAKMEREIEKSDQEPPDYVTEKLEKLKKEIADLENASKPKPSDPKLKADLDAIEKDKKKIDTEIAAIVDKARRELGF